MKYLGAFRDCQDRTWAAWLAHQRSNHWATGSKAISWLWNSKVPQPTALLVASIITELSSIASSLAYWNWAWLFVKFLGFPPFLPHQKIFIFLHIQFAAQVLLSNYLENWLNIKLWMVLSTICVSRIFSRLLINTVLVFLFHRTWKWKDEDISLLLELLSFTSSRWWILFVLFFLVFGFVKLLSLALAEGWWSMICHIARNQLYHIVSNTNIETQTLSYCRSLSPFMYGLSFWPFLRQWLDIHEVMRLYYLVHCNI